MREFKYSKALTHGGVFHADDVFSTAFIKMLNPDIEIIRANRVPEDYEGLIYDIGFGEFDHHQPNNEQRGDGIPYASFGKLWRAFAPGRFSPYVVERMDRDFISLLDSSDNGGTKSQLADAIKVFNPTWDSGQDAMPAFDEAVSLASAVLGKKIECTQAEENAQETVSNAVGKSTGGVVVLPYYCPWEKNVLATPYVKFIVYPSERGGFCIHTVPEKAGQPGARVPFPDRWLGNPDKKLGMTFCHPGNFIAVTDTREQAVRVAEIAIAENINV